MSPQAHPCVHRPRGSRSTKHLLLTLLLMAGYTVAEFVGGILTNSLALLADAGHMLSDVAALALSLFAMLMATRPPSGRRTFGYYRVEIFAAMINGAALIAVAVFILVEAYRRWFQPPEVAGFAMLLIAAGGLGVNLVGLWILGHARKESLNVHGAWLHVFTDALGSVGAMVAGLLIWAFGWYWADPLTSALIGLLVVYSSWRLVAESVSVLLEYAPRGVDVDQLHATIVGTPGVRRAYDLHVWTITSGLDALSVHVVTDDTQSPANLLKVLRTVLRDRFHIEHVTIQMEPDDFAESS